MNTTALTVSAALFGAAGAAFALGAYPLGVWLAIGCAATAAYAVATHHFADRPETVTALTALDSGLAIALAETNTRLKEIEGRIQFVALNISSMSQPTARHADGRLRSPVRPPNGAR